MNKSIIIILLLLSFTTSLLFGQNIKVQPYLQDATPSSIRILWETDEGEESTVEWGLTTELGTITTGESLNNMGTDQVHDVKLEELNRFTTYYYRVQTGMAVSDIFSFKTPPFASDNESFRLVAMSDMQKDNNNPNKFQEIIEEGILDYLETELGGELHDNLAMVLIPGDLVENGMEYEQWEDHFFTPAQNLFNQVPVYPVIGNHERDAVYYYNYFHLPENGTEGFEEHWWYKDYGNTRIIGLDSNGPYDTETQLNWLEEVLDSTCSNSDINFVFAQLHHPHKSELWLPGESDFTGEVVKQLERFSTNCRKPSIHFFGHTHGYSRGQSRDHKHLWINVATSGGAIDYWGEQAQFDYDEFSVSHDTWGFLMVEVTAGDNPSFTVKRLSRGNRDVFRDNELRDSFTVRLNNEIVNTPTPIYPIEETVIPECVVLKANAFSSPNTSAQHGQSHWQVSTDCNDFSEPITESWKNFENYYFGEDTQAGDDLTDENIINLAENTEYCWRVRYRDRELNWSEWSEPVSFTTMASLQGSNLLLNPDAEDGVSGWTIVEGVLEALADGECNGITPYAGEKLFAVGGVCEDGAYGKSVQDVNVLAFRDSIAAGLYQANFGGYLSNWGGSDLPAMRLEFRKEDGTILDSTAVLSTLNPMWTMFSEWVDIPAETEVIRFIITGTRNAGADNDSYFDNLFLRVGTRMEACSEYITAIKEPTIDILKLAVAPNPFTDQTSIFLPQNNLTNYELRIMNALGQKIDCKIKVASDRITISRGNMKAGAYFFVLKSNGRVIGNGRFVVE